MKTKKVAYWVESTSVDGRKCSQYLKSNEFYLVKTMLNELRVISKIEKCYLDENAFKHYFG